MTSENVKECLEDMGLVISKYNLKLEQRIQHLNILDKIEEI